MEIIITKRDSKDARVTYNGEEVIASIDTDLNKQIANNDYKIYILDEEVKANSINLTKITTPKSYAESSEIINRTFNINAVDPESFAKFLSENEEEFVKLIQSNIERNGKLRGIIKRI